MTINHTSHTFISLKSWSQLIQKQTNLSSDMFPVCLDFSVGKGMATIAIQIFKICYEMANIKNYQNWIHDSFLSRCWWHNLASTYLMNKPATKIWSKCVMNRKESSSFSQLKELH